MVGTKIEDDKCLNLSISDEVDKLSGKIEFISLTGAPSLSDVVSLSLDMQQQNNVSFVKVLKSSLFLFRVRRGEGRVREVLRLLLWNQGP